MKIELREKFEKEFEDKEELAKKDLEIKQKKVEDQLRELKEFYEQDKKRMETWLVDEREKCNKKLDEMQKENEERLNNDTQELYNEIRILEEENERLNQEKNELLTKFTNSEWILNNKINQLNVQIQEKELLLNKQNMLSSEEFENRMNKFVEDKTEKQSIIDWLNIEKSKLEN